VEIEVAVCKSMPSGIDCNIGNSLFRQNPQLTDVLNMRPLCQRPPAKNSAQKHTASDPQHQSAGAVSNDNELTRAATPARGGRVSTVMTRTLTRKLATSDKAKPGVGDGLTDEHRESDSPGANGKVSEATNGVSENDTVGQLAEQMGRIDLSDNEPPSAQADGISNGVSDGPTE